MNDQFRTIIVTAADAPLARMLAALSSGGDGMFTTGLSLDGAAPASHYISTGYLSAAFVTPLPLQTWEQEPNDLWVLADAEPGDAQAVYDAAVLAGLTVTDTEIVSLFSDSDVTKQDPWTVMGRLNLQMANV